MVALQKNTLKPFEPTQNHKLKRVVACDELDISTKALSMAHLKLKGEARKHLLIAVDFKNSIVNLSYLYEYREKKTEFYNSIQQYFYKFVELYKNMAALSRRMKKDIIDFTFNSIHLFFKKELFSQDEKSLINFNISKRAIAIAKWFEEHKSELQLNA